MRGIKLGLFILSATVLVLVGGAAYAFHSGGVAECEGCHVMHNLAEDGTSAGVQPNNFLLKGSDASSTCLSCHQNANDTGPSSYHVSTADASLGGTSSPLQRGPGGDFGWLKKSYSLPQPGSRPPVPELGETHGHNIVAADQGYSAVSGTAPGGTFPAINLSCTSCHDQHGQWRRLTTGIVYGRTLGTVTQPIASSGSYNNSPEPTATTAVGVYRLLRGSTGVTSSLFPGVPAAIAPSTYNRAETDNGLNQVRVAYGYSTASGHATWGDWCAACHANIHSDVGATTVHPIDENLGQTISDNYNAYVKTGDLTGSSGSSFWSLVPFVTGTNVGSNYGPLKTLAANPGSANLTGPGTGDQVSCLTCHRAHASGWHYGLRWPYQYELMTTETSAGSGVAQYYPNVTDRGSLGRTQAEYQAALNGRPATVFAPYQRVLCNKCHLKD